MGERVGRGRPAKEAVHEGRAGFVKEGWVLSSTALLHSGTKTPFSFVQYGLGCRRLG